MNLSSESLYGQSDLRHGFHKSLPYKDKFPVQKDYPESNYFLRICKFGCRSESLKTAELDLSFTKTGFKRLTGFYFTAFISFAIENSSLG